MSEIRFKPMDKDTPGYLRRVREALKYLKALEGATDATPELIDTMVAFLTEFIVEPATYEEKVEALYEASNRQFFELLNAVMGAAAPGPLPEKMPETTSASS